MYGARLAMTNHDNIYDVRMRPDKQWIPSRFLPLSSTAWSYSLFGVLRFRYVAKIAETCRRAFVLYKVQLSGLVVRSQIYAGIQDHHSVISSHHRSHIILEEERRLGRDRSNYREE